ncbi:CatB-related O-acetyltransferase [Sandaracinobacteroides saxicola]|uniref:CatB-related O-acetyltransferase n=1 Tax=Sandaracinobacteroides saxicola TaxID=2759707 RepID=A0A7G5IFC6_9SPHN|nr:CatB-related O-acetyltransferase [Sandaracinobacteroides saxicola]QMW22068.1 CatB-related O-acetyltransferase [Sandaracinobacteroides saxicola]
MSLIDSLAYQLKLRRLRRNEYESMPLRRWFARDFGVEVGLYSYGCFDRWRVPARTRIGRWCSFAPTARVVDANHLLGALSTHPFLYDPAFGVATTSHIDPPWLVIEDDVWLGHNVTVTPGCKFIGRGAVIGAGAVVTQDVPAYSIVAGLPAKPLRMRFDPGVIAAIEASRWWLLDRAGLAALVRRDPDLVYHPSAAALARLKVAA